MRSLVGPQFNSIQLVSHHNINVKEIVFFFFERVIKIMTQRKSKPWKNFLAVWLVYCRKWAFLGNSYLKNAAPTTFIDGNTTSNVQLRQIFEQNYNHFAAKHTHWYLQWCSLGRRHLEGPKHWSLKKTGIAWHTDASSVVWTSIYNGKLANQIARLVAIVVKIFTYVASVHDNNREAWILVKRDKTLP